MLRLATIVICVSAIHAIVGTTILSSDAGLAGQVPRAAYEGVGCWRIEDQLIATGHSISYDSLGEKKDDRTEKAVAEDDAKRRMMTASAAATTPDFDAASFDVKGEITEFRTAATYKLEQHDGLFLIGIARADQVVVEVVFNPGKARARAIALFDAGHFADAAARFAALTQRGVQDAETVDYARAAGWHVNLNSGLQGTARTEALEGLGGFYRRRNDYDSSIRHYYELYRLTNNPSRELLASLADLCIKTHRDANVREFRAEIARRWPTEHEIVIRDAMFEKPFESILRADPMLLSVGGARVVQLDDDVYFVAVGVTDVRPGEGGDERLRQLRVAKEKAKREAVAFTNTTEVTAQEQLTEQTVIADHDEMTQATVLRRLDEMVISRVKGVVQSLGDVGTWKSDDGKLFFFAIGAKLE